LESFLYALLLTTLLILPNDVARANRIFHKGEAARANHGRILSETVFLLHRTPPTVSMWRISRS